MLPRRLRGQLLLMSIRVATNRKASHKRIQSQLTNPRQLDQIDVVFISVATAVLLNVCSIMEVKSFELTSRSLSFCIFSFK